ncbi:ROK family protein [Dysgonomonas sp. GY75]|jgi:RNA-binding protein YhbY|uniref:ROK family protein n=1 Tax=Dysgonomonas sp. GY75 TaxID=2780419 RepID=UPI0018838DA6|nr:ROK family protein [Dysgonomonas sp. GY75]MBF0648010.1 ROK family protein [Dysgonomonas sp. GY75]MDR1706962.1 ROK family protein [Prevotella sp.]
MSEPELLKRIAELEARNIELLAENNRFREMLGLPQNNSTPKTTVQLPYFSEQDNNIETISKSSIDKYSSPDEKVELFQSLFRGRTDVYAKRCYSKKHGSGYYIPACKNEWVIGLCDRTRIKCKDCKNRDLLPLGNHFGFANIVVDNDVIAASAGEYWLKYEGKNISVISVGTSISVGSIIDGKVFRGSHNLSGQIAHLKNSNSELTISQLCGGKGISDRLYNELGSRITTKEVIKMAQNDNSVAKRIVVDAAKTIAQVIMFTQNMIAPDAIVCSGSLLVCNDYFYNLVLSYLEYYPQCYTFSGINPLNVVKSNLNQRIGILGSVALCKAIVK